MTPEEIEAFLEAIERRLKHIGETNQNGDDWMEYFLLFIKRAPRDLMWCVRYIRKLRAYATSLEKALEAFALPSEQLGQSAGIPTMRVVKPSIPRIDIPTKTGDLPSDEPYGTTTEALTDAFDDIIGGKKK